MGTHDANVNRSDGAQGGDRMVPNISVPGGLFDLSSPAPVIQAGWFLITLPNLIWFGLALVIFLLALAIELPTKPVDFSTVAPKE